MYNMIKKMGINVNIAEASVLVASANGSNKGELELDQFMNLIFGDSEVLNVNLKDVPLISEDDLNKILKGNMFSE